LELKKGKMWIISKLVGVKKGENVFLFKTEWTSGNSKR
jgi:hypothetical protein